MTLLVTWLAFPLLLAALGLGCGMLVERIAGVRFPGALLPAIGISFVIVVAQFLTLGDATAPAATPVVVFLALTGFALSPRLREREVNWWAVGAAVAVFCVYAAPIVLSGQATWAGFLKLDDTSTWMAITDRVMSEGRSLAGLPLGNYKHVLDLTVGSGYPIGVFLPLGVGRAIIGWDVAWLVQPYQAFLAVLVALGAWSLTEQLLGSPRLRALAAFLGASSALLLGYYLWGGIKEVAAAALIITLAALAAFAIREWRSPRALVPLAIVCGALIGVLSGGGALWLAPMLLAVLVATWRAAGRRRTLVRAAGFAALVAVLSIPVIVAGGLVPPTAKPLTSATAIGNLVHPLSVFQVFGIWPAGDFRFHPGDPAIADALLAVAGVAALVGLYLAVRTRSWALPIYLGGALIAAVAIFIFASPWVAGKALATASPAIPLAAAAGGAALIARGRRVAGTAALGLVTVGVLWSYVLAYHDAYLAPRGQFAELQTIGGVIDHDGPTLMTGYNSFGAAHFLRDAPTDYASEFHPRKVRLLHGKILPESGYADTDQFELGQILQFRTLVLRRSPAQSRPPEPYRLIWSGDYYDVWQRPPGSQATVKDHVGLGSSTDPAAVPKCSVVHRLAREAGPNGMLAAVARDPIAAINLALADHPSDWEISSRLAFELIPNSPGAVTARVSLAKAPTWEVWLGGLAGARPPTDLSIDGRHVASVGQVLQEDGDYVRLAGVHLAPGVHKVSIYLHGTGANLVPGSGADRGAIGPLTFSDQEAADTKVSYFRPSQASQLCGKRWDWIEALSKRPG